MRLGQVREDGSILLSNENIKFREAQTGDYKRIRQTTRQSIYLAEQGLKSVNSSFISAIGVKDNDLYVRFHNASLYVYYGFAKEIDDFFMANSKGQFFNKFIRPTKRYKKLDSMPFPKDTGASPLELTDTELFEAMDFDYIKKIARNLTGADIFMRDLLIDGIDYTQFTINDLVILRPKIISQ